MRGAWNNYEGVGACSDPEAAWGSGRTDGCAATIDSAVTDPEMHGVGPSFGL